MSHNSPWFRNTCASGCFVARQPQWDSFFADIFGAGGFINVDGMVEESGRHLFIQEQHQGSWDHFRPLLSLARKPYNTSLLLWDSAKEGAKYWETYWQSSREDALLCQKFIGKTSQQYCDWMRAWGSDLAVESKVRFSGQNPFALRRPLNNTHYQQVPIVAPNPFRLQSTHGVPAPNPVLEASVGGVEDLPARPRGACSPGGCFLDCQPYWNWEAGVFPRGIISMDVDKLVEVNGHHLYVEEKTHGAPTEPAQLQCLVSAARKPNSTLIVVWSNGPDTDTHAWEVFTSENWNGENPENSLVGWSHPDGSRGQYARLLSTWKSLSERTPTPYSVSHTDLSSLVIDIPEKRAS